MGRARFRACACAFVSMCDVCVCVYVGGGLHGARRMCPCPIRRARDGWMVSWLSAWPDMNRFRLAGCAECLSICPMDLAKRLDSSKEGSYECAYLVHCICSVNFLIFPKRNSLQISGRCVRGSSRRSDLFGISNLGW